MNFLKLTVFLAPVLLSISLTAGGAKYHKAPALPGDGVYSLLRRYKLDAHSCNHSKFYDINNLKNGSPLEIGKKYDLPILVYKYNGKTNRSTVGIDDWNTAKEIESYNELMLKDGYRD